MHGKGISDANDEREVGPMKKIFLLFLVECLMINLSASYALAASGSQKWDQTLAEARKEGKITMYGQVGPALRIALTDAIKKDLGLEVNLVPGKGHEVLTRYATEIRAGIPSADIIIGGSTATRSDPELYATWSPLEPLLILPEVLDPRAWPSGKVPYFDKQKKLGPLTLEMDQFIVVNTDFVKPGQIKSYRDLLQPQWKGKMVMFDPTTSGGTGKALVTLLLTRVYGMAEGEAFLKKLVAQEPVITRDSRLQSEWVARGRYPVCIGLDSQAAYGMQKHGAPIVRVAAEEGGFYGGILYMVIPVKRPHPNAATVLLNWLLSARGQEVYSKGFGASAARLGIKTEGISNMALPLPGEKLFMKDEDYAFFSDQAAKTAKRIFAPLMK